jgi:hypothetical protein
MTTLVRTWTTSWNNVPSAASLTAQARAVLRQFKDGMKNAGWTVDGSSSSTAAGMDGTDRWSADSNLVWQSGGSARSWIVLKSPTNYPSSGKNIWILIACSTGSGNPHLINITYATAAFTSGSTTTDPTAPTNNRAIGNQQFIKTAVAAAKYSILYNTAGDWLMLYTSTGSGKMFFAWASLLLTGSESGDLYPTYQFVNYDATNGALTLANLQSGAHTSFWIDDTVNSSANGAAPLNPFTSNNFFTNVTNTGSNISGKYPDMPIVCVSTASSQIAIRGTMVDIAYAPSGSGIVQGTVEPSSGSSTTTIIGEVWVPNGNTVPTF